MMRPPRVVPTPYRDKGFGMNRNPTGQCDVCGHMFARKQLKEQMEYRGGSAPAPTGSYRCAACYDVPNAQAAAPVRTNDPVSVPNARPFKKYFPVLYIQGYGAGLATEDGNWIVW